MKVKITILVTSVAFFAIAVFFSANPKAPLFHVPSHFPKPVYPFNKNPLTESGIELGKTLFYDALLSKDNTISCGSCHQQASGFTQHGHALSHGINDLLTKRNAMPLANLAWSRHFGWDGGVHDLDLFPMVPIQNEAEMDESLPNILEKLRKTREYPVLFTKAFGSPEINTERFLKALSQFMLTMVSASSRYDRAVLNEGATFTPAERAGWILVERKCSGCHPEPLFTDFSFRNNGLAKTVNEDQGHYDITLKPEDLYKFKVPTLRNVAVTAPYMHDGRFATLEEVVAHYGSGIQHHETLDHLLKKDRETGIIGISLTPTEQANIVAFLHTLTDDSFLQDQRFAESTMMTMVPVAPAVAPAAGNVESPILPAPTPATKAPEWPEVLPVTDASLQAGFNNVLTNYSAIKNALAQNDSVQASQAANRMVSDLSGLNATLLTAQQKMYFDILYNKLLFDARHIYDAKHVYGIKLIMHQRDHFGDLSKSLYSLVRTLKLNAKPMLYHFCPGANQNRGGYWLSNPNDTNNPYVERHGATCNQLMSVIFD
ncbi:hypothetical protein GCM10028807_51000 [Spirosoma daeguense]